ncbi:unnamed protein product [Allacma fusca]|uniref:(S)-2-hydroxy-acid oxidase n=1 Tax=Allacma fusca TaxID=39272 RepID=A0A8J2K928_9HEXA|nr:unnamed protein product [Allacma fusca]
MDKLICIPDFEQAASKILTSNAYEYYKSGADDESTLSDNKQAYQRWLIKPRVLRDVSSRKLVSTVLDGKVNFPVGVSPSAMQKLAHPEGELGMVRAVEQSGSIYILSTNSTCSIEEVAKAAPAARKWFQLYVFKDRSVSVGLVKRAEAAGFEALVLTVDAPLFGRRRANIRNRFALPSHLKLANFPSEGFNTSDKGSALSNLDKIMDQSVTWDDFKWLQSITKLPIVLKGIMSPEDAKMALAYGANAIFVSNHGGRQLDTVFATLDALPAIVKEVAGRCDVYVDGGISTGSDVFKALALGATMVFIGRPALWGLSVSGQVGAKRVLEILRDELDLTMALSGISDVKEIDSQYVIRSSLL